MEMGEIGTVNTKPRAVMHKNLIMPYKYGEVNVALK